MISDQHLLAFSQETGGRGSNDTTNRRREEFVLLILEADGTTRLNYRNNVTNRRVYDLLVESLDLAVSNLGEIDLGLRGLVPTKAILAGGRTNNFDLVLHLSDGIDELETDDPCDPLASYADNAEDALEAALDRIEAKGNEAGVAAQVLQALINGDSPAGLGAVYGRSRAEAAKAAAEQRAAAANRGANPKPSTPAVTSGE